MRFPIRFSTNPPTKTKTVVGELIFNAVGEPADPTVRPAPKQHLMALALKAGFNDFSLVAVENATGNKTLDYLEQKANEERLERAEAFEKDRVKRSTTGPATTDQVKAAAEDPEGEGVDPEALKGANQDKGVQTLERLEGKEGKKTGGDTA